MEHRRCNKTNCRRGCLHSCLTVCELLCSTGNPPKAVKGKVPDYSHAAAGATWRVTFALLIPLVLYIIYYRIFILKELSALKNAKDKAGVVGALPIDQIILPIISKAGLAMFLAIRSGLQRPAQLHHVLT